MGKIITLYLEKIILISNFSKVIIENFFYLHNTYIMVILI